MIAKARNIYCRIILSSCVRGDSLKSSLVKPFYEVETTRLEVMKFTGWRIFKNSEGLGALRVITQRNSTR